MPCARAAAGLADEIPQGRRSSLAARSCANAEGARAGAIQVWTPYKVDTGSGYAEVVQDCVYQCTMTAAVIRCWPDPGGPGGGPGTGDQPYWPAVPAAGQRQGGHRGHEVVFMAMGSVIPTAPMTGRLCPVCRRKEWVLSINSFGDVTMCSPASSRGRQARRRSNHEERRSPLPAALSGMFRRWPDRGGARSPDHHRGAVTDSL